MDAERFDRLSRAVVGRASRRRSLAMLIGLLALGHGAARRWPASITGMGSTNAGSGSGVVQTGRARSASTFWAPVATSPDPRAARASRAATAGAMSSAPPTRSAKLSGVRKSNVTSRPNCANRPCVIRLVTPRSRDAGTHAAGDLPILSLAAVCRERSATSTERAFDLPKAQRHRDAGQIGQGSRA